MPPLFALLAALFLLFGPCVDANWFTRCSLIGDWERSVNERGMSGTAKLTIENDIFVLKATGKKFLTSCSQTLNGNYWGPFQETDYYSDGRVIKADILEFQIDICKTDGPIICPCFLDLPTPKTSIPYKLDKTLSSCNTLRFTTNKTTGETIDFQRTGGSSTELNIDRLIMTAIGFVALIVLIWILLFLPKK